MLYFTAIAVQLALLMCLAHGWHADLPIACRAMFSSAPPALILAPLSELLRSWPPTDLAQRDTVLDADTTCVDDCTSPPRLDFDKPGDVCRALRFARAGLPFVVRNAPGSRSITDRWTAEYLRDRMSGSDVASALELHSFIGDEYRTGFPGNARVPFDNDTRWWADWAADIGIMHRAQDGVSSDERDAGADVVRTSQLYLQVTSGERPFLASDLSAIFDPVADAQNTYEQSREATAQFLEAASLFSPVPAVSANTPIECRFGFMGTRVEVRVAAFVIRIPLSLPSRHP